MRTLRLSLAGTAMLVLLGASSGAVTAQEATADPMAPAAVTGTVTGAPMTSSGTSTTGDGFQETEGVQYVNTLVASDARLSGEVTYTGHWRYYPGMFQIEAASRVIANDGGRWVGTATALATPSINTDTVVLRGEGAYEGLTAYLVMDYSTEPATFVGAIFPGEMPSAPKPATAVDGVPATASPASPVTVAPSAAAFATIGVPADDGARIVAVEELDARMRDLTIESPSVGTVKVRLLLPVAFDPDASTRWPVLYLLQGCCDTYDSWTRETDVEALTADTDLLVVMPAATSGGDGGFGWYTDWYNGGEGGQPAWETFHLVELLELLERNWQAGDDRVIAGLSMGGHGAMTYAARHPGMFKAAASFSGVLHILDSRFDADPRVWGSEIQQADIWAAHDAVTLAPQLEGLPLYVSFGTGEFGPLDVVENQDGADTEAWLLPMNEAFVARLEELGIPATVSAGPGTHTWPYWERGLHEAMPMLLDALGR